MGSMRHSGARAALIKNLSRPPGASQGNKPTTPTPGSSTPQSTNKSVFSSLSLPQGFLDNTLSSLTAKITGNSAGHRSAQRIEALERDPLSALFEEARISPPFDLGLPRRSTPKTTESQITAPAPLPIEAYREQILSMIAKNRVSVLISPTGTGKSTMVPQFLLDAGYERVIVVNPRRTPCVLLAERVAMLDGTDIGTRVGYRHRFHSQCSDEDSRIVFTTPGFQNRREWSKIEPPGTVYIIDEYHEFGMDADRLLLKILDRIDRGEDIKVVIATATLESAPFCERIRETHGVTAPVLEIHARHHPIYDQPRTSSIAQDVANSEKRTIVFLPGKGFIENLSDDLATLDTDILALPLHAGLPHAEQMRNLEIADVLLATNLAQTSLTIDNLKTVICSGLVRRERVDEEGGRSLLIEPISLAELKQQRGRVGRTGDGVFIYHGPSRDTLPAEAPAETQTKPLEGVILEELAEARLRAGREKRFVVDSRSPLESVFSKFRHLPHPVPRRHFDLGVKALKNLGLIGSSEHITEIGMRVAELPLEVRNGKILAWAEQLAKKLPHANDQLLPAAIDLVSVIEAEGIGASEGTWISLAPRGLESVPLMQMCAFRAFHDGVDAPFAKYDIDEVRYRRAKEIRADLRKRFHIRDHLEDYTTPSKETLAQLRECIAHGMIDRLYRRAGMEGDKIVYKPLVGNGSQRILSSEAYIGEASIVAGIPLTIGRKLDDPNPLRLIFMGTAIDKKWIRKHRPSQIHKDSFEAALRKAPVDALERTETAQSSYADTDEKGKVMLKRLRAAVERAVRLERKQNKATKGDTGKHRKR